MECFDRAVFTSLVADNVREGATREAIFDLLEFAREHAHKVEGGQDSKNFHYVVSTRDGSSTLFSCTSTGDVEIALGNFPHLSSASVIHFLHKLKPLSPAFRHVLRFEHSRRKGGTQGFRIEETLVDPKTMKAFKEAVLELQKEIGWR